MYVYDLIDNKQFAKSGTLSADKIEQALKMETTFPQLEALLTRPRSLSLVNFPTNISLNRKNEVESEQ
jgi:hypothetical protein